MAHGEIFSSNFLKWAGEDSLVAQMVSIWIAIPHGKKSFRVCASGHLCSLPRIVTERCDSQRKIKEAAKAGS